MQPPPHERTRLVFLDVLRVVAAVQMIQGHSVDAVLAPAHRSGSVYATWLFLRGLTSVIFLVTAGFSFVLAEERGGHAGRVRRVKRAAMLIAIGYLMHAPFAIALGTPPSVALPAAVIVDVLQCIGVSLLALELLCLLVRRPFLRAPIALAIAATCFWLAPACAQIEVSEPLRPLANYLTTRYGSLFPLLPWAGYVFAGFALATLAFRLRGWAHGPMVLLLAAFVCGLGAQLGPKLPPSISPSYALLKLGCVLGLSALLMASLRDRRLPRLLAALASETLFLYVSHVVILYADHVGLAARLGPRFGPGVGLALALGLLVLCSAGALALTRGLFIAGEGAGRYKRR